jgi:hypothetical protein
VGGTPGGRNPRHPRPVGRGELLQGGCTRAGAIGHHRRQAIGGVPRRQRGATGLANVVGVTAMATARLPQERHARVRRDHPRSHHWVHGRPRVPAVPPGAVDDLGFGVFGAVAPALDMHAWALQRANAGRKPPVLRRGRGHQTRECSHPRGIQGLQRPAEGLIVTRLGSPTGCNQTVSGLLLETPGDEVEGLSATPSTMEHQRFDAFPHGEVPQCRVLVRGVVDHVAHAECVEHASHTAAVVHDWAMVGRLGGPNPLLA